MKTIFNLLTIIIKVIATLVFASGVAMTILAVYDFFHAFSHLYAEKGFAKLIAIGLLQAIDMFLIAIVCFVFSLGILVLFYDKPVTHLPVNLPEWLRIKDFIQLKVILWEAILTTLVVAFLAGLVQERLMGIDFGLHTLVIPGAILLIALSLFFLKKGESKGH